MITLTNLSWPDRPYEREDRAFGRRADMLVSFDVEWTKNYRVKNGNVPFCYSLVYLRVPADGSPLDEDLVTFGFKSVYVESESETQELIRAADADLSRALERATLVTGHQLSSDLSVLLAAADAVPAGVASAKEAWAARRRWNGRGPEFYDTRYDMDGLIQGASRRLVDVCAELRFLVEQPEIKGSMTAMHRAYLSRGSVEMRERISVLNIRHSLSGALVALYGKGKYTLNGPVNVNRVLQAHIWDFFAYMNSKTFQATL